MADITGDEPDKGRLLGSDPLEEAAKTFNTAIDKLSKIYDEKIKPAAGAAQSVWTGKPSTFTRQNSSGNAGEPTFTGRSSAEQAASYSTWRSGKQAEQNRAPFNTLNSNLYGFAGPSFPAPSFPSSSNTPNGGGPNIPRPRRTGQVSPGSSNAGGAVAGGAGLAATFKSLANYGNKQLQTQLPMDQYVYQGSLGMTGNLQQNQAALRRQAFGQNNQNLNAIANDQQDAAQMYTIAGQVAGTPLLNQTQSGRTINQAMSVTGVLNPYMSGTQNAQTQADLYSGATSLGATRMGLMSPRQAGSGNARDLSKVADSWMKSFFGGREPSPQEINAAFGEGGKANVSLAEGMGLSQSDIQAVANIARAQAQVRSKGGNWNDAEKLIDKARQGDTKAGEELQDKYGLDKSLVQSLKNKQAAKTGRDSDTSAAFNKALSDATDTLQKFSKALTAVMNQTGLTGALGTGGAWASQLSGSLGGFSGALSGIGGLYGTYAMGKFLMGKGGLGGAASKIPGVGKLFGGGTTGAAAADATGAEAATVGTAAEASGGAAAAAGPAGLAAVMSIGVGNEGQKNLNKEATKEARKKGYKGPPLNSVKDYEKYFNVHNTDGDGQDGGDDNSNKTANKSQKAGSKGQRATGNADATKVIKEAEKYIGRPYHMGGTSPKTNFDCSGLMQWSFKQGGMSIPRLAKDQQTAGKNIPKNQVRAGDLIFKGNPAHHVALMIDNKTLLEAPHTGATIRKRKYTPGEWTDARRLIGAVGNLKGSNPPKNDGTNNMGEDAGDTGSGDTGDSGTYGSAAELTSLQDKLAGGPKTPPNTAYGGVSAYATGTRGAKQGVILTGERGAELVHTDDKGNTSVWNAKQTADMLSGNNDKPMHDMLMGAGLATARKSGTGNVVNLNFNDNAIVVKTDAQTTTVKSTTSKQVRADIQHEDMLDAIASGKKN